MKVTHKDLDNIYNALLAAYWYIHATDKQLQREGKSRINYKCDFMDYMEDVSLLEKVKSLKYFLPSEKKDAVGK